MPSLLQRPVCFLVLGFSVLTSAQPGSPPPGQQAMLPTAALRDVSLADYGHHLQALLFIVDACARARDRQACDPAFVGADDRIALGAEHRAVHYSWLRALLQQARSKDNPAPREDGSTPSDAHPSNITTTELLRVAHTRLVSDLAQAGRPLESAPAHAQEHAVLGQVLAGDAFRRLKTTTRRDTLLERLNHWLNSFFAQVYSLRPQAPWLGRVLVWGFVFVVGVALVWRLLQQERRWRVQLILEARQPVNAAASARDWQIWLDGAHRAAAEEQWRQAVHLIYWAVIARLESRRHWPADRARTPREYLSLVDAADPHREKLAALSRTFERTWYGGRPAAEADYRRAEQQALALIEGDSR